MSKQLTIRVTDPTIINGAHAPLHSVHTLEEGDALLIIGAGRAERHVEAAEAKPEVEHASAAPEVEKKPRARRPASAE